MKIARNILIPLLLFSISLTGYALGGSIEDKLIGTWELNTAILNSVVKYNKDHTFTIVLTGLKNAEETGQWHIKGGELITILKTSTHARAHISKEEVSKIIEINQSKMVLQSKGKNGRSFELSRVGNLNNAAFRYYLAKWYEKHNNKSFALEEYLKAYSLDSTNTEMLMDFGSLSVDIRHPNRARLIFTKLLQSNDADKYLDSIIVKLGYLPYRFEIIPEESTTMVTSLYEAPVVQLYANWDYQLRRNKPYLLMRDNRTGKQRELPPPHHSASLKSSIYDPAKNRILVVQSENDKIEVYATDIENFKTQLLYAYTQTGEKYFVGKLRISKGGDLIVFSGCSYLREPNQDKNSHLDLYYIDFAKENISLLFEVLANPMTIKKVTNVWESQAFQVNTYKHINMARKIASDLDFTISKDSKKIYYFPPGRVSSTGEYFKTLWEYDLSSKTKKQLISNEFENPYGIRPTPDGNQLIFLTMTSLNKRNKPKAIKIINLEKNTITSLDGTNLYSFINHEKIMFGFGDAVFEYDLAKGKKNEVLKQIPNAGQQAVGFAKDGNAIFYKTNDERYLKITLPPEKLSAKEFLSILNAPK